MLIIDNIGAIEDLWNYYGLTFTSMGWKINHIYTMPKEDGLPPRYRIELQNGLKESYVEIHRERIATLKDEKMYVVDFGGKIKAIYSAREMTKEIILKGIKEYIIETK